MLIYDEQKYFKNTPLDKKHFSTKPLSASIGGEIIGLKISDLTDNSFSELAEALYHHKMIFLRDQIITPEIQESFTLRFGEHGKDAYTKGLPDNPNIQPVIKEANTKTKMVFGGGWHTDSPFLSRPPSISIIYGVVIPPYGGDTIWYNSAMAYNNLSDIMKNLLSPLKVHMSGNKVYNSIVGLKKEKNDKTLGDIDLELNSEQMIKGSFHPLIRTHPITNEKAIYVDKVYTKGIEGMSEYESTPLINFLVDHITQEVFSCRLKWQKNTLCLWDNRSCLHRAFNDYDGFRRVLHRTTVLGEIPI